MKIYFYNATTREKTETADKTHAHKQHERAMQWFRAGDNVCIINADTGEVVITWEH